MLCQFFKMCYVRLLGTRVIFVCTLDSKNLSVTVPIQSSYLLMLNISSEPVPDGLLPQRIPIDKSNLNDFGFSHETGNKRLRQTRRGIPYETISSKTSDYDDDEINEYNNSHTDRFESVENNNYGIETSILPDSSPARNCEQDCPPLQNESSEIPVLTPSRKYCNVCERTVITVVDQHPTFWSFLTIFIMFLICGWITICIVPFVWPFLQIVVHYCPTCDTALEKKSRVACFKFREKIVTVRIGTCALVLSRRYVIGGLGLLTLIFTLMGVKWYISAVGFPDIPKGEFLDASWPDFLQDCGFKSYLGNPIKAELTFVNHYAEHLIRWEGRLHHVQEGIFSKNFMYIDMLPPQYMRDDYRDINLIFGTSLLPKVAKVDPGDQIIFEATLVELGRRGRPHLGVLWDFNVTAKQSELPPMGKGSNNPFFLLQQKLGPPFNFQLVAKNIQRAHQYLRDDTDNHVQIVMLPIGDQDPDFDSVQDQPKSIDSFDEEAENRPSDEAGSNQSAEITITVPALPSQTILSTPNIVSNINNNET